VSRSFSSTDKEKGGKPKENRKKSRIGLRLVKTSFCFKTREEKDRELNPLVGRKRNFRLKKKKRLYVRRTSLAIAGNDKKNCAAL